MNSDQKRTVLEAEVLGPDDGSSQEHAQAFAAQGQGAAGGQRFGVIGKSFTWSSGGQRACFAPIITLSLFLVCLVQFGVLAGIGFVFFHVLGSALAAVIRLRLVFASTHVNPWFFRLCVWVGSFLLTAWLAGGMVK